MRYFLFLGVITSIGCSGPMVVPQEMKERNLKMHEPPSPPIPTPISDEMESENYNIEFTTKVCHLKLPIKKDSIAARDCSKKWLRTFVARLKEGYGKASPGRFEIWCDAHPLDCQKPHEMEKRMAELAEIGQEADDRAALDKYASDHKMTTCKTGPSFFGHTTNCY